jgi:glycosyltransferase involved in cell wall biosynthesis
MPSDSYLVFSGRLSEEKGVAVLIEAWRSLRDIPLLVVGDGPLRARLEFEVARDQLPIRFTGNLPRDEAVQIVSSAQGVIVPSLWFEGMPMVVLEAWSVGVPVLASRIGGLEEMLSEDRLGFGFAPGDPQSLVAAVRYLMQNPAAAKDRVERAREVVQQRHSREYSLHLMESVYHDVMARRAA